MGRGLIERVLAFMGLQETEAEVAAGEDGEWAFREEGLGGGRTQAVEAEGHGAGRPTRRGKVISLPRATQAPAAARAGMRVVVAEPLDFEEVQAAAAHLKAHRPVVVSLRQVDRAVAKRIVDFLSGTVYAVDGSMQRVAEDIVLCTPPGVAVELETSAQPKAEEDSGWETEP